MPQDEGKGTKLWRNERDMSGECAMGFKAVSRSWTLVPCDVDNVKNTCCTI